MSQVRPHKPVEQKRPREKDRSYLDSFRDRACEACGRRDDTVVGAHVRAGNEGGMGRKPDDALTVALCSRCHAEQEAEHKDTVGWWFTNVFKQMLRRRYVVWLAKKRLGK